MEFFYHMHKMHSGVLSSIAYRYHRKKYALKTHRQPKQH